MHPSPSERAWVPAACAVFTAGWGVNQFTPLSVVYRTDAHWPVVEVALMFSTYLLGLVPALLWGGIVTDRFGRRVVRPALLLSAGASVLLAVGSVFPPAVFVSRFAAGIAAGIVLSAGITWVAELSGIGPERGARRATYATGGGFGAGALVAGCLVQWCPAPMVLPGLIHAALALVMFVVTRNVPETAQEGPARTGLRDLVQAMSRHPRFVLVVMPPSPAVFAAVTVAYVVLPPLVFDRVPGYEALFSGAVTALTLFVGIAIQPLADHFDQEHTARATLTAMTTVIIGLLIGALAVLRDSVLLVLLAAACLGAGYGLTLASGLTELERLAPPAALPTATSIYHGAAHSGLLTPLLLAVTAGAAPYPALLLALALIGAFFLSVTAWNSRRHLP